MSLKSTDVVLNLHTVMQELLWAAAHAAAISRWSDKVARKQIKKVWENSEDILRKKKDIVFTREDILSLSVEDQVIFGFRVWAVDNPIVLIPLWIWSYIEDGSTVFDTSGRAYVKGIDDIDHGTRFGCIEYGFLPDTHIPKDQKVIEAAQ